MSRKILETDLTFVFQGPEVIIEGANYTLKAIRSAKIQFPQAKIVFSTWEGLNTAEYEKLDAKIILSKDPGSHLRDVTNGIYLNLERQLITSGVGLREVDTKYAIKIRSDMKITSRNLLRVLNRDLLTHNREKEYTYLRERVVVLDVTSIDPKLVEPLPFHPCDWLYAGLTEDLKVIFPSHVSIDEKAIATYYMANRKPENNPFPTSMARFHPESYIFSKAMENFTKINFDHLSDIESNNIYLSERQIFNNLYITSQKDLGVKSLKHKIRITNYRRTYSLSSWRALDPSRGERSRNRKAKFAQLLFNSQRILKALTQMPRNMMKI